MKEIKLSGLDQSVLYKKLDNLEKRRLWASIIDYVEIKDKNNMKIVVY